MLSIILYVPNIIDYIRLIFLLAAWYYIDVSTIFLGFYIVQAILDYFDGYFARSLKQISSFGAWLDVIIDNLGRGILWVHVHQYGYFITSIEWITFSCTSSFGAYWKEILANQNNIPFIARKVMEKNFKTTTGFFSIIGLHCLPIWLYILKHESLNLHADYYLISQMVLILLIIGRFLCIYVEFWLILKNIQRMIYEDLKIKNVNE